MSGVKLNDPLFMECTGIEEFLANYVNFTGVKTDIQ